MKTMTKHPVRITVDALKQAFSLNGFTLYDNGEYPELEKTEINIKIFENPAAFAKQILLVDGQYALRTQLLPFALPHMRKAGEIRGAVFGKVFDGSDAAYPAHLLAEGVIASDMNFYDYRFLWKKLVKAALGAGYSAELMEQTSDGSKADMQSWGISAMKETTLAEQKTWAIVVTDPEEKEFVLGYTGTLTWMGQALLGAKTECAYAFSIDVDALACTWLGIESREKLFDNKESFLGAFTDGRISGSEAFEDRCRDVLRTMGYSEGFGPKVYPDGIYKKMNMIQDEWDLNNKGVLLTTPLGEGVGLPTVLTPALEQILSEKWKAGEKEAKTFEVSHIFMPQRGSAPIEKLAISFGSFGENVTLKSFIDEVDSFLTKIGNKNHFFLPNNMAIAYKLNECRLILDEKMSYLGGNFGGVSEIAEKNFGIETHAFMANLEIQPLADKAAEEYGYIPPELR